MDNDSNNSTARSRLGRIFVDKDVLSMARPSEINFGLVRHAKGDPIALQQEMKMTDDIARLLENIFVSRFAVQSGGFLYFITDVKRLRTDVFFSWLH